MAELTQREKVSVQNLAEAVMEFLIALDIGRRSRMPALPVPQVEVKLPESISLSAPAAKPINESKPPLVDPAQMIGPEQVAKLLGCSARHVYRLADIGKLPRPRKVGALVRWSLAEIRKWVEEGCPSSRPRR